MGAEPGVGGVSDSCRPVHSLSLHRESRCAGEAGGAVQGASPMVTDAIVSFWAHGAVQ